jgi:hypothetical protein
LANDFEEPIFREANLEGVAIVSRSKLAADAVEDGKGYGKINQLDAEKLNGCTENFSAVMEPHTFSIVDPALIVRFH